MADTAKSARKSVGRPFQSGKDERRGKGPAKGAPNAGRPPDWLKQHMAKGRDKAVITLRKRMRADELDSDQLLKLVKEWAPEANAAKGAKVTVAPDGTVTLDLA